MGCIYPEGIYVAKECALKQLYNSGRQLSGTSRRYDVAPELDSGHDGLISEAIEENNVDSQLTLWHDVDTKHVAYGKPDMELAQRPNMIYIEGMYRVFSIHVIVYGLRYTGRLPSWSTFIPAQATKERLLQMDDIVGDGHKFCFPCLTLKGGMTLQSIQYYEVPLNLHGIWHEADLDRSTGKLLLEDGSLTFVLPQLTHSDSESTVSKWVLAGVDVYFFDALAEEVLCSMLAFEVTGKYQWLYTSHNQCSIPIHSATFTGQTLEHAIETKLIIPATNASYFSELISFIASGDSNKLIYLLASDFSSDGPEYTREDLEVLPIFKNTIGTSKKLHIQDTCMMSSNTLLERYKDQFLSYRTESIESVLQRCCVVPEFQDKVRLEEKPKSQQEDILRYLYINCQTLQHNSSVIGALKETNLVTSADEQSRDLYKPKDLFDLGDALLTSVFSGEVQKFPGKRFASDGWIKILRKTGLQNTCDADTVLECARRVELLGVQSMKPFDLVDDNKEDFRNSKGEVPFRIWSLAKTLISVIFENFDTLYSNNFCNILGKIVCVPAEEGFPFGSGKKSVKRVLCSYSDAILLKDWRLAWNAAPILSRETLVPPKYSWGALQLKSPPPFAIVLKHLQAELHTDSFLFASEKASFEVLKYLDSIWDSLSSSDIFKLKQVAFIAVDNETCLVTCHSLFVHMPINLSPLASKLPPCYLPFVKVLKELGSEDMLSISSAMNILTSLKISCGNHRLNPNELHAVIEILHFLCNETKGQQQTLDRPNWVSELVVPDDGCQLVPANSSVYIDPYASQYVKFIDSSKLKFVHRDVSERVCLAFGISKLSDIVVEELDYVQHLQTPGENIGSVPSSAIKQKLLSRSFQVAVSRVLNTFSSSTTGSEHLSFETLQRSLESVAQRLQFVQNIYSRFWLLPKSLDITHTSKESIVPEWESGSIYRALYYVDRSNSCMLIAKPPSYVSIIDLVAIVVSHVLGSAVPLPIGFLFTCPQDSEIVLVNTLKLSYEERVMDSVGCDISFLGREVDPEDAEKSFLDSPRGFYRGQIVAWGCKEEKKLKYSRIVEDVAPPGDHRIYKINLETSPGKTETTYSSLVYYINTFQITNQIEADVAPEYVDNALNRMDIEQPDQSGRVNLINQGQTIKEFEHGQISAEELIFAVEEMLADDRIGMDMEKRHLLLTTLSLQERLKESQAALLLEQEKSELAAKETEMAKTALLCRLCLTNEIDITVVPCGHVLCLGCASAISCCPVCSVQLSKTIKIYWP